MVQFMNMWLFLNLAASIDRSRFTSRLWRSFYSKCYGSAQWGRRTVCLTCARTVMYTSRGNVYVIEYWLLLNKQFMHDVIMWSLRGNYILTSRRGGWIIRDAIMEIVLTEVDQREKSEFNSLKLNKFILILLFWYNIISGMYALFALQIVSNNWCRKNICKNNFSITWNYNEILWKKVTKPQNLIIIHNTLLLLFIGRGVDTKLWLINIWSLFWKRIFSERLFL